VTYLCQHNEEGALGIVVNRSAEMKLGEIFKQMPKIRVTSPCAAETLVLQVAGGSRTGSLLHTSGELGCYHGRFGVNFLTTSA